MTKEELMTYLGSINYYQTREQVRRDNWKRLEEITISASWDKGKVRKLRSIILAYIRQHKLSLLSQSVDQQ